MLLWLKDLMGVTEKLHMQRIEGAWAELICHAPLNCDEGGLLLDAYLNVVKRKGSLLVSA